MLIGESCGGYARENQTFRWYKQELRARLDHQELFQFSGMLQHISSASTVDAFFSQLQHFNYLIRGIETVWLCLNLDWDGINNVETEGYRTEGYTDRFYTYMHRYPSIDYRITPRSKLASMISDADKPGMYYHFPLHYNDRCIGCIILRFQNSRCAPDDLFQSWLDLVSNALETLRIRCYLRRFGDRTYLASVRDPLTGVYNRRGFEELSAEMYEHAVIHQEQLLLVLVRVRQMQDIQRMLGGKACDRIRRVHLGEQKVQEHVQSLSELRQEIYQNPAQKWTVDAMARMTMLSRAYFQRMYKQSFGVIVSSDIIAARIALAKKLLRQGDLPVYRIAAECGYSSEIYFMQQFKKETGMTPTQFQQETNLS